MGGRQAVALYALELFEAPMRDSGWSFQRVGGIHFPILGDVLLVIGGSYRLPKNHGSRCIGDRFSERKFACDPQENFLLNNRIDYHRLWETDSGCLSEQLISDLVFYKDRDSVELRRIASNYVDSRRITSNYVELRIFRIL